MTYDTNNQDSQGGVVRRRPSRRRVPQEWDSPRRDERGELYRLITAGTAACRDHPELFWPSKGGNTRQAQALCEGCEIREQCQAYASAEPVDGFWAGRKIDRKGILSFGPWLKGVERPELYRRPS